jgi:glycosyltransferase involved in cell wall biosynthesis
MRVGWNVLHLVPGETGGSELLVRRLVPALLEGSAIDLTLFVAREATESLRAEPWGGDVRLVELPVDARRRSRRVLAEQVLLPGAARRSKIDLLHNLFTTAPAVLPGLPQVTTILDVIYKRVPDAHEGVRSHGMAALTQIAARRSARVLAISEASKVDFIDYLGVDVAKIDVTPLGPGMRQDVEPLPESELRRDLDIGDRPFVLTVSAFRVHKNLDRLLRVFSAFSADRSCVLVLPGYPSPYVAKLKSLARALGAADRVRFTGWVDARTLEAMYRHARCMIFPSLAEGFGLPVLEAMSRGLPLATSSATSMPEVAGDAAVYFDPTDEGQMLAALRSVFDDEAVRGRLIERGLAQARSFTWERSAQRTLESYSRAMGA